MGLRGYIFKRIIYTIFLIIFVISLNFVIFEVMPGNPLQFFGESSKAGGLHSAEILKIWGWNEPWYVKYVFYLKNFLTFQLNSIKTTPNLGSRSVPGYIMNYLPNTLVLMGLSTMISIIIGVILGVLAAYKRGSLFDTGAVVTSLITFSLPTFWMGLLAISIFSIDLHILPAARVMSDTIYLPIVTHILGTQINLMPPAEIWDRILHLIMPVAVLTLFSYGNYLLLTRATMLESLTEDYILTAKAKGLKERTIIFKHALKNASLPIITSSALSIGFLIGGAIITETVFSYPGIGWLTIYSIFNLDYPVLQVIFYITALTVIFANFASDLLYGVIDPRIKYG